MSWGEHLKTEWEHIKEAPVAFLAALLVMAGIIWAAMEWAYRASLQSANNLNRDYEARLNGWSPEEAQRQVVELQEQVRRLSASISPPLAPEQAERLKARITAMPARKISVLYNGPESYGLAKSLHDVFASLGWPSSLDQALGGGAGTQMFITDEADLVLVEALKEQMGDSLKLQPRRTPKEDGISIYVGFRAPIEN